MPVDALLRRRAQRRVDPVGEGGRLDLDARPEAVRLGAGGVELLGHFERREDGVRKVGLAREGLPEAPQTLVDALREVPRRYPDLDLGLWHLGGTRIPFGKGALVTMDAAMGADLLELVHPRRTVPIHNDDYRVFTSPRSAFLAETTRRALPGVRAVDIGERVVLPLP